MSGYDGPSYYKKNHPKIKPFKKAKAENEPKKKVSWADQDNYFKSDYEATIPDRVQTRTDLQKKAREYMRTPQTPSTQKSNTFNRKVERPKRDSEYRFRSKQIPRPLQQLDGWQTNSKNVELIAEVEKRLEKETHSYLLFEEYLVPEVAEALEEIEREEDEAHEEIVKQPDAALEKEQPKKTAPANEPKNKPGEKPKFDEKTKRKAERVQENLKQTVVKPNAGLHRSLGKIIAEDQEALKNGKNHLGSLFSDDD